MLLGCCFLALGQNPSYAIASNDGPKIGDVPPPLTLSKTLQGSPASEISWDKLQGKVVVLEFWATWCAPCIQAIPHLNELAEQFKDRPVIFISLTSENEDVVRLFLRDHPMKTWVGLDDYEVLNKAFHVQGIPHAVIVDVKGRIAAIAQPEKIEARHLEEVLAGKKCSLPTPVVWTTDKFSSEVVPNQIPPLFEISIRNHPLPEKWVGPAGSWLTDASHSYFSGKIATIKSALDAVFEMTSSRMSIDCKLPAGFYDFELRTPPASSTDLQNAFAAALRSTFNLDVRLVSKEVDSYVLTQVNPDAPGLVEVDKLGGGGRARGRYRSSGSRFKEIVNNLETLLGRPVFDESGSDGIYSVDLKWKLSAAEQLQVGTDRRVWRAIEANPDGDWIADLPAELREGEALKKVTRLKAELAKPDYEQFRPDPEAVVTAVRERLGLKLTPARRSVEVLEVTGARR